MATATVPVQTSSRVRLKYLLFGFVGLMIGYVLVHNESFLVHRDDPVWQHYHSFRWYLLRLPSVPTSNISRSGWAHPGRSASPHLSTPFC